MTLALQIRKFSLLTQKVPPANPKMLRTARGVAQSHHMNVVPAHFSIFSKSLRIWLRSSKIDLKRVPGHSRDPETTKNHARIDFNDFQNF